MTQPSSQDAAALFTRHSRKFADQRFVYPVVSRRSGGVSIGVNLNPDKICNFDCIYCQVERVSHSETRFVEIDALLTELEDTLRLVSSGAIFEDVQFSSTPTPLRRLNDIAFSGDGEPTTYRNFDELIERCAAVKSQLGLNDVKMVLITNASMFHRSVVRRGLEILDRNNGEIWAKLDAGTEDYYQKVDRTKIAFQQVLDNIAEAARTRPLVIQSLFMRIDDDPPTAEEVDEYCKRLSEIVAAGGSIKLVQIYTVARLPAESNVTPLTKAEVDAIVDRVRTNTKLPAEAFYGPSSGNGS